MEMPRVGCTAARGSEGCCTAGQQPVQPFVPAWADQNIRRLKCIFLALRGRSTLKNVSPNNHLRRCPGVLCMEYQLGRRAQEGVSEAVQERGQGEG